MTPSGRERADTAIELTQSIMHVCGIRSYSLDKKAIKGIWARFALRVAEAARREERKRCAEIADRHTALTNLRVGYDVAEDIRDEILALDKETA